MTTPSAPGITGSGTSGSGLTGVPGSGTTGVPGSGVTGVPGSGTGTVGNPKGSAFSASCLVIVLFASVP